MPIIGANELLEKISNTWRYKLLRTLANVACVGSDELFGENGAENLPACWCNSQNACLFAGSF